MTYQETVQWMFSQLPMYQRKGKQAFKKDLTNTIALANHLGNPEKQFKSIHVGGTNGKGSTSHMLASILQEQGYKVGLYTSPHLKDYRERIKINGEMISETEVVHFIEANTSFLEKQGLSFFEMTVGLAFYYFAQQKVDIAIIEVGLGGRLDSTNIINPELAVITNIGYDHQQMLGETLVEIAGEKAGIIKKDTPIIIGQYQDEVIGVFKAKAKGVCAGAFHIANKESNTVYSTDLLGDYQKHNVTTTVCAINTLRTIGWSIEEVSLVEGLQNVVKNTKLRGRWEVLNTAPKIICDTAHNKEGLSVVMQQLLQEEYKDLHIVLGMVNDKNIEDLLVLFPKDASYYFCKPNIPRGLEVVTLKSCANAIGLKGEVFDSVNQAYSKAKQQASQQSLIYIGGSTFVVAEII